MPADLTIFAAKYLVFIDALLAAAVVAIAIYRQPRLLALQWAMAAVILIVLGYLLGRLGSAVYNDPRPFAVHHFHPLIPHPADNGFPSDHALLAAAVAAVVGVVRRLWMTPFVLLAVLIDWARVGAGIHHITDVVWGSAFVALAWVMADLVVPPIAHWLTPHLPEWAKRGNIVWPDTTSATQIR